MSLPSGRSGNLRLQAQGQGVVDRESRTLRGAGKLPGRCWQRGRCCQQRTGERKGQQKAAGLAKVFVSFWLDKLLRVVVLVFVRSPF